MAFFQGSMSNKLASYVLQTRKLHSLKNKAFINGEWVDAKSGNKFAVLDPATEEQIAQVPDMEAEDAKLAISAAANTFQTWGNTTAKERSQILRKWYEVSLKNTDRLAKLVTAEAGKPVSESIGEINYGHSFLEYFADAARHVNGEIIASPWPNKQILLTRQPVGVVSVITPWNFPYAMITRKVGALMAAGCTCVIKPSEDTPLTALLMAELADEAGVPKGVINVVTSSKKNAPSVGKVMCTDPDVAFISFTGSTPVGKLLYGLAATGVKRVGLELGGNAPFIVFESADIDLAVEQAMLAKFRNAGQACIGANRFLLHEKIYNEFIEKFQRSVQEKLHLGPGSSTKATCGPLINSMQAEKVSTIVSNAMSEGAKAKLGGKPAKEIGPNFYEPTILVDVKTDMNIHHEEIFGPVAVCYKFSTEEEVLKTANNTMSGLAAYVFTKDLGQSFRMSRKLNFGMVAINDGILSAAEAAFGGIKESGIGREGSLHGVEEYTDIKYTLVSGLNK